MAGLIPPPLSSLQPLRPLLGLTVTDWEVDEAVSAGVAKQAAVVGLAEAAAREVLAGAISEVGPAVATCGDHDSQSEYGPHSHPIGQEREGQSLTGAGQRRVEGMVWGAVVGGDAALTVDPSGVVLEVREG